MPKFSVIIPTYNRASYLKEALDSVFTQTFNDYEVLLIDDGSTDETSKIAGAYGTSVRYVYQENQGRSRARNKALCLAKGEFLAFLDSDDYWFPDKLERQARYLSENPDAAMVHGHVEVIDKQGGRLPAVTAAMRALWETSSRKEPTYENWALQCCCILSTAVIRRECLEAVGNLDPEIHANEELDLYLRIAARYKIGFLSGKLLAYYRLHEDNSGTDNLAKGNIQVAHKHLQLLDLNRFNVNKTLARRNFELALSKSHFILGDVEKGRKFFCQAVRRDPRAIFTPPLRLFLASWLPKQIRQTLRFFRKQFFPTPFEQAEQAFSGGRS